MSLVKLAFCLFRYFPFGGLQRDFLRIAKESKLRGHEVDVFTMQWGGDREGLNVYIVPTSGYQNHTRSQSFVEKVRPKLKAYDLVLGFNKMPYLDLYYAADTCYQAKSRAQRSMWYRLTPRYRHQVAYEKAVFAPTANTKILLLSEMQREEFIRHYHTQKSRFYLLPPGIERDRIAPINADEIRQRVRSQWNIQPAHFLFLMVGSGFKTKGLDRILHGVSALPTELKKRVLIYVIGQDRSVPFKRMARKLKLDTQIKFLGGRHDVAHFLLAADLLLHPAYNENTGTVLLEALAAGLPILTTDICGYAHYVVKANAGIVLASPYQQQDFNHALASMLCLKLLSTWKKNACVFAQSTDLYSLPPQAVDIISDQASKKSPSLLSFTFDEFMALEGQIYRKLEGRCTQRVTYANQAYFIKQHSGIGWREIFKNLLSLRLPVLGAKNEWMAIKKLKQLKISVADVLAFGKKGTNPARQRSFILTREIINAVSLEDYCRHWRVSPPKFDFKNALIKEVARIARTMHTNGINHRDFYICHFLLDLSYAKSIRLYVIDLHRAQCRKKVPLRWTIKDLAGLYYSSKELGLTERDLLRFIREYRNTSWANCVKHELNFWRQVKKRGDKLYQKQNK